MSPKRQPRFSSYSTPEIQQIQIAISHDHEPAHCPRLIIFVEISRYRRIFHFFTPLLMTLEMGKPSAETAGEVKYGGRVSSCAGLRGSCARLRPLSRRTRGHTAHAGHAPARGPVLADNPMELPTLTVKARNEVISHNLGLASPSDHRKPPRSTELHNTCGLSGVLGA